MLPLVVYILSIQVSGIQIGGICFNIIYLYYLFVIMVYYLVVILENTCHPSYKV